MDDNFQIYGDTYQILDVSELGNSLFDSMRLALAYNNRCWAYAVTRRVNEALRDCNESLRLSPDRPAVLDSRALAYWLLDNHEKAQEDLDRARQIDPSYPPWQDRFDDFKEMFK